MAQSKITEIRELSTEELTGRLRDLKQEALNLRLQQATGQLENTARRRLVPVSYTHLTLPTKRIV